MSKPSKSKIPADKPQDTKGFDRRRFFMMGGSAVAAAAVVPLTGEAEAAESDKDAKKARYRETDHVKNFYRVNRY
ncbi:hypothetical protein YH63_020075 [Afipia massiliensis]|uniref:Formate dehydrogenase n=1 Tax=Afipia massiliensis TaxID=211460 RepID=A0A4U6BXE4_9BRAD|nr:hypothetical protein [Afipia massiliensis]TKT73534.1 hypothetical protein YH63_020075 [Afipia massiliensis]